MDIDRELNARQVRELLQVGADGLCRLDRRIYTDPRIFELELRYIWEKNWIFLAHESELPTANDFVTRSIGRQPILLMRNEAGGLGAFINACAHRGAQVCRVSKGNARLLSCPYHGWTYDTGGRLKTVPREALGAYPESFDKRKLGLTPLPKLESYRGLVFGSLDAQAPTLRDYLGDAAVFIDLLLDQSTGGWEVIKGRSAYTFNGNWKLQAENGVDGYHAPVVHGNFAATIQNRRRSTSMGEKVKAMNVRTPASKHADPTSMQSGFFDLGHGHVIIWRDWDNVQDRFNYEDLPEIAGRIGELKAKWAVGRLRNLLIFPSLMLMDQMSTQLRVIEPVSVDRTRITGYPMAPLGEAPEQRRRRLRAYEDFFNASGMATPDDLAIFNISQIGFKGSASRWSDISRGATHQVEGSNPHAAALGISPRMSGAWIEDEGLYVGMYRSIVDALAAGLQEQGRG